MSSNVSFEEIAEVIMGQSPSAADVNRENDGVPLLNGPTEFGSHHPKPVQFTTAPNRLAEAGDILFCVRGSTTGRMNWADQKYAIGRGIAAIRHRTNPELNPFIKGVIDSNLDLILQSATGSTFPNVTAKQLYSLSITPDLNQAFIAKVLGDLDRKIELNRRMNETLEQIGQALFKKYFVDNPESSEWNKVTLGDIIQNFDSKRVPLSSRERAQRKGTYRYYGATSVMDYVDDFIFEGKYLLLAEDGSVINEDSTPVLQYVWGQFWVNNHAHVLQAKEPFTIEYLYLLLRKSNVRSLVSGAVQLKINQKAMNSFPTVIPPEELLFEFNNIVQPLFALYRKNVEEVLTLEKLRDSLLPKLMSGQVNL